MNDTTTPRWTLVIHGGAGTLERARMTPERDAAIRAALKAALAAGSAVLAAGGAALDAIEAAICVLEDHPDFNAGRGAVFTAQGTTALDAAIMDGRRRAAGAVAGVSGTRNPICLARKVMEQSPHVLLAGEGADEFSRAHKLEQAAPDWFWTEDRWQALDAWRADVAAGKSGAPDIKYGTVGAVARDMAGNLAAGTSTGGTTGKRYGRVGDSPIIGAGTYADNRSCAVSTTGAGEFYIRTAAAHAISARMQLLGEAPREAADAVQAEAAELGGEGGVIVVARDGRWAFSFNTPGMYRGAVTSEEQSQVAIYGDE